MTKEEKSAYDKLYYKVYKDRRLELNRAWRNAHPDRVQAARDRWKISNPDYRDQTAARVARRYAAKKCAIPKWADLKKIKAVYEDARMQGLHVDHVIPLQSKLVCGLHVHTNLRVLSALDNFRKGNRVWPDMPAN